MTIVLGSSDVEILETLALRIGPITVEQFAAWREVPKRSAGRRMNQLHRDGWLWLQRAAVRLLPIGEPLYAASPGDPDADWGMLAYRSRNRYRGLEARYLSIYSASRKCYQSFGVRKRASQKPHHLGHELALTSIFMRLSEADEGVKSRWRPEDLFVASCDHGRKVPDVLLVDPESNLPIKGVDFLGPSYSADRLRDLNHEMLNVRQIPIELY